jgi:membrane-associated protease RseP (regulator of RpoE activity)
MTDDNSTDDTQDQQQEDNAPEPEPEPEPGPKPDRAGVFVPRWLAILLGLVIVILLAAGGGFWAGRETADDHHDNGRGGDNVPREQPERPRDVPSIPFPVPELPSDSAAFLGVGVDDSDSPAGALVVEVAPGSPAEDAGVQEGDVIVALDGDAVDNAEALGDLIAERESGDVVTLTVDRDGVQTTLQPTLGDPDAQSA